jgi:hypothetical protein
VDGDAFEEDTASWLETEWSALISPGANGCATIGGVVFEWMDEPWKAEHAADLGGSCVPDRGGLHAGWGPNAFPDACANEAFFGLTELQPDE